MFTCLRDSSIKYIGLTNRTIKTRAHEHLRTGTTAISDHLTICKDCENGATIDNFEILKHCRNEHDTRIFEALMIKKKNPSLNVSLKKPVCLHSVTQMFFYVYVLFSLLNARKRNNLCLFVCLFFIVMIYCM